MLSAQKHSIPVRDLHYIPDWLPEPDAARLFATLRDSVDWQQDRVRLFGKEHPIPRLHQWYGDSGCAYRWSGLEMQPRPWLESLAELRAEVEGRCGCAFNSVLVNLYRDGSDSMGWHADDEPELGPEPVIASISLGAVRDFHLRRRSDSGDKVLLPLEDGSLLIMAGSSQQEWQHSLPKRKRVKLPRINLTFRQVLRVKN